MYAQIFYTFEFHIDSNVCVFFCDRVHLCCKKCLLIYVSFPYKHFKIGGDGKRMVVAWRIDIGDVIIASRTSRQR
jgi:hypothetical protein